ncbi:GmrSD restriction endonuclease domain-containing protein [Roseovarius sp. B08]|uniref:GmrSD restriction endonuclease domain-containing protein n=1 Tax=Roseovarius sp. B08 TaxID=3449223 RepID=UPI003EDC2314
MAVSPKGISIQSLYREYRDGTLVVNRQYQRKLVWTIAEKVKLIESILLQYPIPLILLAEKPSEGPEDTAVVEVIDGMQRLNAIFSFIEHGYTVNDRCFDLKEFARARQAQEEGLFEELDDEVKRLDPKTCSNFLDYQMAVTSFSGEDDNRITDIFGRINSGGKQLSDQERRQAGVLSNFAELVRELGAELRGDVSKDRLALHSMPEISIETSKNPHGYKLKAEEIFWCQQGILRTSDLRDSDDEEMIIDICASVLKGGPVDGTRLFRDSLYDSAHAQAQDIEKRLAAYGKEKISAEIKMVFSAFRSVVENSSSETNYFRKTVYPSATSNAQKSPFYAAFMAFFELIIKESMFPDDPNKIMGCLNNLTNKIEVGQKQTKADDRKTNINITKGLIRDHFTKKDIASFSHGPGVILDFENSISRAKTETSRYEFKQGFLRLNQTREMDPSILDTIVETVCGIANAGPDAPGYLYIGIADKDEHADRIKKLDGTDPVKVRHVNIVGIEREAKLLGKSLDDYLRILTDHIQGSSLSEPLKTTLLTSIDSITYKDLEVVRVRVPAQKAMSFVGDDAFYRSGSETKKATGPQIAAISANFQ